MKDRVVLAQEAGCVTAKLQEQKDIFPCFIFDRENSATRRQVKIAATDPFGLGGLHVHGLTSTDQVDFRRICVNVCLRCHPSNKRFRLSADAMKRLI